MLYKLQELSRTLIDISAGIYNFRIIIDDEFFDIIATTNSESVLNKIIQKEIIARRTIQAADIEGSNQS